jgi:hypothetical protein
VSVLRARCPDCRTLTAVALGGDYQCHSCGREFAAGLVRVPRAWSGPPATAEAAWAEVPWPEAAVVEEETLAAQVEVQARSSPERPLVLGGCGCAHLGAVQALARRGPIRVVWVGSDGEPPEGLGVGVLTVEEAVDSAPERLYVAVHGRPEPGLEELFASLPQPAGAGFSGLTASEGNAAAVARLAHALGL